jgi:hypothetical protein
MLCGCTGNAAARVQPHSYPSLFVAPMWARVHSIADEPGEPNLRALQPTPRPRSGGLTAWRLIVYQTAPRHAFP